MISDTRPGRSDIFRLLNKKKKNLDGLILANFDLAELVHEADKHIWLFET